MLATCFFNFSPFTCVATTNVVRVVAMRSHTWDKEAVPWEPCRRRGSHNQESCQEIALEMVRERSHRTGATLGRVCSRVREEATGGKYAAAPEPRRVHSCAREVTLERVRE